MATPTSREELKQYALRKLGAPVIEINVDDAQLEDALDDSLQIFNEYHFDGVQKALFKVEVTADDITNGYLNTNSIGSTQGPGDSPQVEGGDRIVWYSHSRLPESICKYTKLHSDGKRHA